MENLHDFRVSAPCEGGHAVDDAVYWCDYGMGEMMIYELYSVEDLGSYGDFCHNCVSLLVLERYTNIPAICTAKVP